MSWYVRSIGKAKNVARQVSDRLAAQSKQAGHAPVLKAISETVEAVASEVGGETLIIVDTSGHVVPASSGGTPHGNAKLDIQILGQLAPDLDETPTAG